MIFPIFFVFFYLFIHPICCVEVGASNEKRLDIVHYAIYGKSKDSEDILIFDSKNSEQAVNPTEEIEILKAVVKLDPTTEEDEADDARGFSFLQVQLLQNAVLDDGSENWSTAPFVKFEQNEWIARVKVKKDILAINGRYSVKLLYDESKASCSLKIIEAKIDLKFPNAIEKQKITTVEGDQYILSTNAYYHPLPLLSHTFSKPFDDEFSIVSIVTFLFCTIIPFGGLLMMWRRYVPFSLDASRVSANTVLFLSLLTATVCALALYFKGTPLTKTLQLLFCLNIFTVLFGTQALRELRELRMSTTTRNDK